MLRKIRFFYCDDSLICLQTETLVLVQLGSPSWNKIGFWKW